MLSTARLLVRSEHLRFEMPPYHFPVEAGWWMRPSDSSNLPSCWRRCRGCRCLRRRRQHATRPGVCALPWPKDCGLSLPQQQLSSSGSSCCCIQPLLYDGSKSQVPHSSRHSVESSWSASWSRVSGVGPRPGVTGLPRLAPCVGKVCSNVGSVVAPLFPTPGPTSCAGHSRQGSNLRCCRRTLPHPHGQ